MACDSCTQNLRSELEDKDEEDLSDEERQILEGEEAPKFVGPLSPVDVKFCSFCHGIGQVGALFWGLFVGIVLWSMFSLGIGMAIGGLLWLSLAITVGYVGYFPVLGPLFGPIVESIFASQFNIYLTKKAEDKYAPQAPQTQSQGQDTMVVEDRFPQEGTEMHVVASPEAFEQCADMDTQGALLRVEIDDKGQMVDFHNFHPKFNKFPNVRDHVGFRRYNNVCEAKRKQEGPVTLIDFQEVMNSQGKGGIE